ncbi:methionine biosynthesis protein MetW [Pelagicoccus sp. SDUM812002]|uniref:methionine biosynthesis protein MetW n=1 Tax=Pelagicoccus sp. SDUM812002 TaxID=3041266 RepID=UPI0028109A10|nr:methionine biosynthesis protein MetW [Pelagicoccus sp. SDUM812002]MDQ8184704.1 methionine biosynthesis protein MetW [Pelagicoccus sp. SDUM812002]
MKDKRTVDMRVMSEWVQPGSRVLDLGCGRGVLLEYLKQKLGVEAVGVDLDPEKARSCVKRGISVYMGDMMDFMKSFPDKHFDYVICSRTMQELSSPSVVIEEALRVSSHMLVGFVNYAYWRNRLSMLLNGRVIRNEVYPSPWSVSRPSNPVSVQQFEIFCRKRGIQVERHLCLGGNWETQKRILLNLLSGYAVFDLKATA